MAGIAAELEVSHTMNLGHNLLNDDYFVRPLWKVNGTQVEACRRSQGA